MAAPERKRITTTMKSIAAFFRTYATPGKSVVSIGLVVVALAIVMFVCLKRDWALRADLFRVRQVLASQGGVELSSDSLSFLDGIKSASVLITSGGRGRIEVIGRDFTAVLLVNDRWWLNFPDKHLTLVGRDDLPAFDLGDTFPDKTVIPPLAPPTFDPNALFLVIWSLPQWGKSEPVPGGWKFVPARGKLSLLGLHDPQGLLTSLQLKGGFLGRATLNVKTHCLTRDDCALALATPGDFTAAGAKVEEVPTVLLQKSIYGAFQTAAKGILP